MLTVGHRPRGPSPPHEPMQQKKAEEYTDQKKPKFFINDHVDILIEILKHLDGPSLCVASIRNTSCVYRLWGTISRNDSLGERLCFRHVSSPPPSFVRPVVVALGSYKRLFMVCDVVQLSLYLFCVDYYEKRLADASVSSLMFPCKPVNVCFRSVLRRKE
ncbi:F-box protein SNE-like [Juglans regia]|uniref:F-box protein SNE-like n=1 Tax=Juglans regia TaxID=51240 RepID=A0A6P9EKC9_JUGRE|nr:F-box protein SNE-like [Juglans regia]